MPWPRSAVETAGRELSWAAQTFGDSTGPDILVVNELFPPAIGGSAVLLYEVYRRLAGRSVAVLTDEHASPGLADGPQGSLRVVRRQIATRRWGVISLAGDSHHLRVARLIGRMSSRQRTIVHCGRALPEGIAAWISHGLWGPRYICWGHGEDVASAMTSRELTHVMTRVYRSAAAVIANSHSTRKLLLGLGLPDAHVHVAHPGVDPTRFHPDVDGRDIRAALLRGGDTLMLSVGRLQRRKGHDLAIAAMAALKDSHPGLRYAITGDGDERARLERLIVEHRLADRVIMTGVIPDHLLPNYYAACDVFLMPNRQDGEDIEGFGIVFLEAASSERSAIGGRSGGVPEAIDDGRTGLLVGGTDASELAAVMGDLATSPAKRQALGRAGRARVLRSFTWDLTAAKVAAINDAAAAMRREDRD
jgi:phosphatidylinositol alpha-1,6-mannosyltransferase